ncbi:MAG: hypothetical protein ISP94_00255 [SAR86 cluster bacterium]|nr:hypothetical protein [SAR86 cluster bacterium]
MKKSNFIQRIKDTYSWNFISNILNFGSLIFASSLISTNSEVFAVYSVVFSLFYLIGYFDFGFTSSAIKFYSEYYQINEDKGYQILGFIFFIFLVLGVLFATFFIFLGSSNLMSAYYGGESLKIFQSLISVSALFVFTIAIKKLGDVFYTSTIQTYIQQKAIAIGSIVKILLCFYCFIYKDYLIYQYFLGFLTIELFVALYLFYRIVDSQLNFALIARNIKFNRKIFKEQYQLAAATIFGALVAIICYENDVLIAQLIFDASQVYLVSAIFFLALPIKRVINIFFMPLSPRLNHFYGKNNNQSVNSLFLSSIDLLKLFAPFFSCLMLATPEIIFLIYGNSYIDAVGLFNTVIFAFLLIFFKFPLISYFRTYLKTKTLLFSAILDLCCFLLFLYLTKNSLGLYSIFLAKVFSGVITIIYLTVSAKHFTSKIFSLFAKSFIFFFMPILFFLLLCLIFINDSLISIYFKPSLIKTLFLIISFALALVIAYNQRNLVKKILILYNSQD